MRMRNWLLTGAAACVLVLSQAEIASAQQVTAGLRGQVTGSDGAPVVGAVVKVTSDSTGATLTSTTGSSGTFTLTGLSVSGTYTVRIAAKGYEPKLISHVSLSLGETSTLNIPLGSIAAETVVVTGARQKEAATAIVESRGVATSFDAAEIRDTPTVDHDFKDIIQNSSFAYVDPVGGGDNPPVPTLNVAGANPRCTNFLVDGIQVKDNFGLNLQGYPTARAPIPTEWADQVQLAVTPYDVEYNDTCGGTINVVTKSGSNEFHGSAYYYYKNDAFNGKDIGSTSPLKPPFEEQNYGAELSGPIIPDRLFFFVGYDELKRVTTPDSVGPAGSNHTNTAQYISQAEVDQVTQIAKDVYGFDAGNLDNNFTEYNQRYTAKLTWQIDDNNKLVADYAHTTGGTLSLNGGSTSSTTPQVSLPSDWYVDAEKLETYSLQYFGKWTQNLSAELYLTHESVRGNQTPPGGTDFPEVLVRTPGKNGVYDLGTATSSNNSSDDGYIVLGPDIYRHYNFLFYKNDSVKALLTYTLGDHTLKGGIEVHRIGIINSFTPGSQSVVRFDSISDFQNGIVAQTIDSRSNVISQDRYSSVYYSSGPGGNPAGPNAVFNFYLQSAFLQDEWYITDHLSAQAGVRYDQYTSNDVPTLNPYFEQRYGIANTRNVNGLHALLPRFSISYTDWVPDQDLIPNTAFTFRAGIGKYSGGFQTVWISNSYANTGITSLTTSGIPGGGGPGTCTTTNPWGCVPAVMPADHQQWLTDLNNGPLTTATVASTSNVNAILPNFKLPTTLRMNVGMDIVFGDGFLGDDWQLSIDYLHMNDYNQPYWTNMRLEPSGATAPDGRTMYQWTFDQAAGRPDPAGSSGRLTGQDIGMGSKNGGGGDFIITTVQKEWDNTGYGDFNVKVGYTHSKDSEVFPATSSTASSSYYNHAGVNFNDPDVGTSSYQRDHRVTVMANVTEHWLWDLATRINIFGQHMSGQHYSLVFSGNPFIPSGSSSGAASYDSLVYVPAADSSGNVTATSDPSVTYSGSLATDANIAAFNQMLHDTGLIRYAGHIAPRNSQEGPWSTLVNMSIEQELPTVFEGHHLIASIDIFNLGNLINKDWGTYAYPKFFQNYQAVSASIVNGKYNYTAFQTLDQIKENLRTSRTSSTYQIQFGVRYQF